MTPEGQREWLSNFLAGQFSSVLLPCDLSGTVTASRYRSDQGSCKRARNHSAAEMAGVFASLVAKQSLAASNFLGLASKSQEARSNNDRKSPPRFRGRSDHRTLSLRYFPQHYNGVGNYAVLSQVFETHGRHGQHWNGSGYLTQSTRWGHCNGNGHAAVKIPRQGNWDWLICLECFFWIGVDFWEVDEDSSVSVFIGAGSLNGPDLFTELPFL